MSTLPAPPTAADVRQVMRRHDENFPVLFRFLDRERRTDMAAVYAFCRTTDDIGDELPGGPEARLAALDAWEDDVRAAFAGSPPEGLGALALAARRRDLVLEPFLRLIEANRMDQRRNRWDTREALRVYCTYSATPVGHMVLGVLGYRDRWRQSMSDATCMGLQLVNFWQDIRRDIEERGRIYLPQEDMAAHGVQEADLLLPRARPEVRRLVAHEVGWARQLLEQGAGLWRFVPRSVALDIQGFTAGGLALCQAIADQGYDTLHRRPAPGAAGRARIMLRVAGMLARGRFARAR